MWIIRQTSKPGHETSNCYFLLVCSHCKKNGHDVSRCYELVGYPDGWFEGKKGSLAGHGRGGARTNVVLTNSAPVGSYAAAATTSSTTSTSLAASGQIFTPDLHLLLLGSYVVLSQICIAI